MNLYAIGDEKINEMQLTMRKSCKRGVCWKRVNMRSGKK